MGNLICFHDDLSLGFILRTLWKCWWKVCLHKLANTSVLCLKISKLCVCGKFSNEWEVLKSLSDFHNNKQTMQILLNFQEGTSGNYLNYSTFGPVGITMKGEKSRICNELTTLSNQIWIKSETKFGNSEARVISQLSQFSHFYPLCQPKQLTKREKALSESFEIWTRTTLWALFMISLQRNHSPFLRWFKVDLGMERKHFVALFDILLT